MFIQLHVICIFVLFMKHLDVHNDWFMWTKVSYVWINLGYCRNICLRISRAVEVTKLCKLQTSSCSSVQISSSMKKATLMIFLWISMKKPLLEVGKLEGMLVKSCWWLSGDSIASMILNSTEAIVIQNILPRRATLLFRRDSHWIRYDPCVWKRCWTWFRRWLESVVKGRGMVLRFISRYVWSISRSETWNCRE